MTRLRGPVMRGIVTMVVVAVVSALAIVAGFWQYGRYERAADARDAQIVADTLPPVPLTDVVPHASAVMPDDAPWRVVTATGVFDPDSVTVLRNRPVDGNSAWHYLAWLDTDDGQSLLVTTGWIPQPGPNDDPAVPILDGEPVTVTVVLREFEGDDGRRLEGSATRIDPTQVPEPRQDPVPGYGMLREVCDAAGCSPTLVGEPVPVPTLSLGPHLAYAWQWWVFAAMAPVGGVLLIRREREESATTDAATTPTAAPPPRRRARRRREPSDEEIEDALQ